MSVCLYGDRLSTKPELNRLNEGVYAVENFTFLNDQQPIVPFYRCSQTCVSKEAKGKGTIIT